MRSPLTICLWLTLSFAIGLAVFTRSENPALWLLVVLAALPSLGALLGQRPLGLEGLVVLLPFWYGLRRLMYAFEIHVSLADWALATALPDVVIALLFLPRVIQRASERMELKPIDTAFTVLLSWTLIQIFNVGKPLIVGLVGFHKIGIPMLLYWIGKWEATRYEYFPWRLARLTLGCGVVVALYGLVQATFGYLPFERTWLSSEILAPRGRPIGYIVMDIGLERAFSTFSGPGEFGTYLSMALLSGVIVLIVSGRARRWIWLALIVIAVGIIPTYNRTSWLMWALGLVVGFGVRRVWGALTIACAVLVLLISGYEAAAALGEYISFPILQTMLQPDNLIAGTGADEGIVPTGRLSLWVEAVRGGRISLLGEGLGAFSGSPWLADTSEAPYVHNDFLLIAQELGWVGLGIFALFNVLLFGHGYSAWKFGMMRKGVAVKDRRWLPWTVGILFTLSGVRGMIGGFWTDFTAGCYFWLLAGIIAAQPVQALKVRRRTAAGAAGTATRFAGVDHVTQAKGGGP